MPIKPHVRLDGNACGTGRTEESVTGDAARRLGKPSLLWVGFSIFLLAFLAHGTSIFNGFIWDDDAYVYNNPTLQTAGGLRDIWLDPAATPQYYPLVYTTFWIENAAWGLRPAGYHADNILLHAASSVFLLLILRRLHVPGAWLAAAIFAIHPVHVESVAWVTERKNTLSGFFYLTSLHAYLSFSPADHDKPLGSRDWRWYGISLLLLAAALLSKTVTCTLPAAILLICWWKRSGADGEWMRVLKREGLLLVPSFAMGLGLGYQTACLEKSQVGAGVEWDVIFPLERCLIAGNAIVFYAYKLIWPTDLAFIYGFPLRTVVRSRPELYVAPLLVASVLTATFFLRGKISKGPFTGVCFFALTLFPALGFFNVFPFKFSIVADHFQYLASIGIIVLLAAGATTGASWLKGRSPLAQPRLLAAVTALYLFSLIASSVVQTRIYVNADAVWLDTVAKNPGCSLAHNNLGMSHRYAGRDDLAKVRFTAAVRADPAYYESRCNMGRVLLDYGQIDDAIEMYRSALRTNSHEPNGWLRLGEALKAAGMRQEAHSALTPLLAEATRLHATNPKNLKALFVVAEALELLDRDAEAIGVFRRFASLTPEAPMVHFRLGKCLLKSGRADEGVRVLSKAIDLSRNDGNRWVLLESMNLLSRIEAAGPIAVVDGPQSLRELAQACVARAEEACGIATEYSARYPICLDTKAMAHAACGRYAEAVEIAIEARDRASELQMNRLAAKIEARRKVYEGNLPFRAPIGELVEGCWP